MDQPQGDGHMQHHPNEQQPQHTIMQCYQGDDQAPFEFNMQQPMNSSSGSPYAPSQCLPATHAEYFSPQCTQLAGHSFLNNFPEEAIASANVSQPCQSDVADYSAVPASTGSVLQMPWRASDQSFSLQPQSAQFPDLDLSYYWPTNNEAVQFGYTSPIGDEPLRDGVGEVASGSTPQSGFPHVGYTIHQIESHILPPNRAPCAPIEPSPKSKRKVSKPRLVCVYPGCKSTFPRRYELQRHENTIHKQTVSMLCPVYGCNRTADPFPRLDKFREHVGRKHKDLDKFLCLIETCRIGPLTRLQLKDHLENRHLHDFSTQSHFGDYIAALPSLGIKLHDLQTRSSAALNIVLKQRSRGKDICPLENLGCRFRLSQNEPFMEDHLKKHDLKDLFEAHDEVGSIHPMWDLDRIQLICPICHQDASRNGVARLLHHVLIDHYKQQRLRAASQSAVNGVFRNGVYELACPHRECLHGCYHPECFVSFERQSFKELLEITDRKAHHLP